MNKSTVINRIKLRLGSREDTDLNALIESELAQAQWEQEQSPEPYWFLLTESARAVTVLGEQRISLPTDFLLEVESNALWMEYQGETKDLEKVEFDEAQRYFGTTPGMPKGYSLDGLYFNIWPVPDGVYDIWMKYYGADTDITTLSDTETNKWLTYASDLLMGMAGLRVAMYIKDKEASDVFGAEVQRAQTRLSTLNTVRAEINMSRSRGF